MPTSRRQSRPASSSSSSSMLDGADLDKPSSSSFTTIQPTRLSRPRGRTPSSTHHLTSDELAHKEAQDLLHTTPTSRRKGLDVPDSQDSARSLRHKHLNLVREKEVPLPSPIVRRSRRASSSSTAARAVKASDRITESQDRGDDDTRLDISLRDDPQSDGEIANDLSDANLAIDGENRLLFAGLDTATTSARLVDEVGLSEAEGTVLENQVEAPLDAEDDGLFGKYLVLSEETVSKEDGQEQTDGDQGDQEEYGSTGNEPLRDANEKERADHTKEALSDSSSESPSDTSSDAHSESDSGTSESSQSSEEDSDEEEARLDRLLQVAKISASGRASEKGKGRAASDEEDGDMILQFDGTEGAERREAPIPNLSIPSLPKPYLSFNKNGTGKASAAHPPSRPRPALQRDKLDERKASMELDDRPYEPALSKRQKAAQPRKATASETWSTLPAPRNDVLPQMKRDYQALALASSLDPKRFMKGGTKLNKIPETFAIGHMVDQPTHLRDTTQIRETKYRPGQVVQDLVRNEGTGNYAKRKYGDLQWKRMENGRGRGWKKRTKW